MKAAERSRPRHGCGSKEHAAEAIEAEPSAPAMVKREACRVIRRDHEADESKQAEAVVQNRGVVHPAAEVVKQLSIRNTKSPALPARQTARPSSSGTLRRAKAPARRQGQRPISLDECPACLHRNHAARTKADRAEGVADKIASHRAEHLVIARLFFKRHR